MSLQDELDIICDSTDVPVFEAELFSESAVYLDDWETLLQFVRLQGISNLFYMYEYYIAEDYSITADDVRGWDTRVLKIIQNDIRSHNATVADIDFNRPCGLFVYCLHEGFAVIAELDDDWIVDENLEPAEEALEGMLSRHSDRLQNIRSSIPTGKSRPPRSS